MNFDVLRHQLITHEGERLKPYVDTAGKITIGIGRNLTDKGLSREETWILFENDIKECVEDLWATFPWFRTLDEVRQRALISLRFNLGPVRFRKFKTTLGFMASGEFKAAGRSFRQNRRYFAQVGKRARDIALMIETGEDPV